MTTSHLVTSILLNNLNPIPYQLSLTQFYYSISACKILGVLFLMGDWPNWCYALADLQTLPR